jgi:hypothetical protein
MCSLPLLQLTVPPTANVAMPSRDDIFTQRVLRKCRGLRKVGFWDKEPRLNPNLWLANFADVDQTVAVHLLDKLIFFSDSMVDQMLTSTSRHVDVDFSAPTTLILPVEGEVPNPTDSGFLFCRKARKLLRIDQARFHTIDSITAENVNGITDIIFIDDFIGTGDQLHATLQRLEQKLTGPVLSGLNIHYLGVISTEQGVVREFDYSVIKHFTHVVGDDYNICSIFRDAVEMIPTTPSVEQLSQFLITYSAELIVPSYVDKIWGFGKMGLSIAFSHSVPDATLPIFWAQSQRQNWTPLIPRS